MKRKTLKQIQSELKNVKRRDVAIIKHLKGEISLSERKVKNKKAYNRTKYKKGSYDLSYFRIV